MLALLFLTALAIGTGSGLILGYLLAGSMLAVMVGVTARRLTRRVLNARLGKPRFARGSSHELQSSHAETTRRAA
jgi:hypothetical protein